VLKPQCEVCHEFEAKLQQIYEEMAVAKVESRKAGEEAKKKLSRLLSAKHSHEAKQGCLRQGNETEL